MATTKRTTKRKTGRTHLGAKLKNGLGTRRTLQAASKKLTRAAIDARERFTEVEETVQKYAKSNPWKTMGITLLAGVVVGRVFGMFK